MKLIRIKTKDIEGLFYEPSEEMCLNLDKLLTIGLNESEKRVNVRFETCRYLFEFDKEENAVKFYEQLISWWSE